MLLAGIDRRRFRFLPAIAPIGTPAVVTAHGERRAGIDEGIGHLAIRRALGLEAYLQGGTLGFALRAVVLGPTAGAGLLREGEGAVIVRGGRGRGDGKEGQCRRDGSGAGAFASANAFAVSVVAMRRTR